LSPRRQARFVAHRVIPPEGCEANRWYNVCSGRRREDNRPGVVVLDLGTHRVTVPEIYVELREDLTPHVPAPRRRWRRLALAVTVPLGVIAVATVGLIASDPR
jgi:hypothetical protein